MQDKIRVADAADLDSICHLDAEASGFTLDRTKEISRAVYEARCFVMASGANIQGFAIRSPQGFRGMDFLDLVVVSLHERRQGIATSLITHFRNMSRTAECWTSTNQSNLPMIALLRKLQWRESGHIEQLDLGDPELFFFIN